MVLSRIFVTMRKMGPNSFKSTQKSRVGRNRFPMRHVQNSIPTTPGLGIRLEDRQVPVVWLIHHQRQGWPSMQEVQFLLQIAMPRSFFRIHLTKCCMFALTIEMLFIDRNLGDNVLMIRRESLWQSFISAT